MTEPTPLKFIAFEDKEEAEAWRVEALDKPAGVCYIAVFLGPDAQYRAVEYAKIKNNEHPGFKAAPQLPKPVAEGELKVPIQDNQEIVLEVGTMKWTWDFKRHVITGRPKPVAAVRKIGV